MTGTQHLDAETDAILSSMADGLIIFGPDGQIVRMNPAAASILGCGRTERGRSASQRRAALRMAATDGGPLPLEDTPAARALHGETVHGVVLTLHRGRELHWISASAAPIHASDGHLLGAVMTFTDITDLHDAQEQRERLLEQVEHQRFRMEETMRLVAHDVRQPLTAARGFAQFLRRSLESGDIELARSSVAALETSTHRLEAMIEELVGSAELEVMDIQLKPQPVDLGHFVHEALERLSFTLDVRCVQVKVARPIVVHADPNRLERVLGNLVTNSVKYCDPGTAIAIRLEKLHRSARVVVSDCGPGIDPTDLPHLFERGYRAAVTPRAAGQGLGLYITRALIEAHGGRLWAESTPGRGSSFFFTLPLVGNAGRQKALPAFVRRSFPFLGKR